MPLAPPTSSWLRAGAVLLFLASSGTAQVLHIAEYASASREYRLTVDPTLPSGAGPATCTMRRGGEVLWEREVETTPWLAAVTDGGAVFAFGYEEGLSGETPLVVFALGPDGEPRGEHVARRERIPRPPNGPLMSTVGRSPLFPEPSVIVLDESRDLAYLLVSRWGWLWWEHRLSDAALLETIDREERDYELPPGYITSEEPGPAILEEILTHHVEDDEWEFLPHTYAISEGASGESWSCTYRPEAPEPRPQEPLLPLVPRPLGKIRLQVDERPGERLVRDVRAIGPSPIGTLEFVSSDSSAPPRYVLLDAQGGALVERDLDVTLRADLTDSWFHLEPGRFVLLESDYPAGDLVVTVVDAAQGRKEAPTVFEERYLGFDPFARARDGRFALLSALDVNAITSDTVVGFITSFDERGRLMAEFEVLESEPEAIALDPDGSIWSVRPVWNMVRQQTPTGELLREIDLELEWRDVREPSYPSEIEVLETGDLVVGDKDLRVTMHPSGAVVAVEERPPPDEWFLEARTPDGARWGAVHDRIVRLDEAGEVELLLGAPAPGVSLREPSSFRLSPGGEVLVEDSATNTVHAFRQNGTYVGAYQPLEAGPSRAKGWFETKEGFVHRDAAGYETALERRPDRRWLTRADGVIGGEGILTLLDHGEDGTQLLVYDAEGDLRHQLSLLALGERWSWFLSAEAGHVLVGSRQDGPEESMVLLRRSDGRTWSIESRKLGVDDQHVRDWLLSPAGELWGLDTSTLEIHRFELP